MATALPPPDIEAPRRRMHLRRQRGGFSSGGAGNSTSSESLRLGYEPREEDEVDEGIDPDNLNARVRDLAATPGAMDVPGDPDIGGADAGNPRARLNDVALAGSRAYSREYRLGLLARMLMRNVPLDQIARQLQVSISTVEKDRAELRARFREQAKGLDINELVGQQSAFYDEVRAMSMRIASSGGDQAAPVPMKLAAMRTALASEADRTRFLNTAGVFDVLRFRRSEDGSDLSDVQLLMQRTDEMLEAIMTEDAAPAPDAEAPAAPTSRRVQRKRGGFGSMDFGNQDASNSQDETVTL
jgi:hypothetical protein